MYIFTKSFKTLSVVAAFVLASLSVFAQNGDSTAVKRADSSVVARKSNKSGLFATGTILDASTGKPLSGINISVFEYSAAITDDKGNFSVEVPTYLDVLLVSGQGYQTKEVALKGRKSVTAYLYEDGYASVYNVARLPFGSTALNQVPNSVSTINVQGAWEANNETPDTYVQGKVAGLNAIRRSGTPQEGADLYLRGYSSIFATNKPLIVVDGMIYDDALYGSSLVGGHYDNPLAHIDINDIDNITVLKDGASMYGTKAANGVILITTGHTNDLATHIDFGAYSGFNFMPKELPVLGASDYRVYLSEMLKSSGMTDAAIQAQPYMNDNVNSGSYYAYHNNTDWQKQVFHNSFNQNYYLRVSGGDNIARYTLSMGYGKDGSITQKTNLSKYNTRFNADLNLTPKLTMNANLSFDYSEQNLFNQGVSPKTNPIFLAQVKSPFLRLHQVDSAGVESPNFTNLDAFATGNPVTIIDTAQEVAKSYRFTGSVNFKYQFSKYLSAQTLLGATYDKVRESYFIPRSGTQPDTIANPYVVGTANAIAYSRLGSQVERLYQLNEDTRVTYDRIFGRVHHIVVNVGSRLESSESQDDFAKSFNSPTDQFLSVGTGASATYSTGGELGNWLWWNNYMGVDYSLKSKYFLSYNMAIDASSRFGTQIPGVLSIGGLKYATLPSLSAGWLISSEPFMANVNFITLLKLRASYGLTGNDDIGNYASKTYYVSQNFLTSEGLVRGNIGNSQLQWEVNKKANIGVDASLLKERLSLSFDIYQNTTSHMLINEPAPAASGFTYVVANDGGMQTQGIEFAANGRIINTTKWRWDMGFNIAKSRNKITQLNGGSFTTQYAGATVLTQVGSPAGLFVGYKTNGVYTSDAEAAASGIKEAQSNGTLLTPHGGDVRFVDINHDGVIDSKDATVIGNPNPDFTGGINTALTYKRITLSALFTFSKGNQIFNYVREQLESEDNFYNQTADVLNRWRVNGQVTNVPKATYGDPIGNSRFSDRWIEDGSYLRLRTLTATYNVPIKVRNGLKSVKVYATANNLFTLTKYLGYDPEFSATQSVLTQGIDTGLEPLFRSVQLGIRIGL